MHRLVLSVLMLPVLATAALPGALASDPRTENDALLLTGGTLVDPRSGAAVEADLLIVDGRIVAAGRLRPEAFAGEVVDASGRWIVPGLRDLHVHAFSNQAPGRVAETLTTSVVARRMLYAGVTGFLMIPTLANLDTALATDPAVLEAPLLRAVAGPRILEAYSGFAAGGERAAAVLASMEKAQATRLAAVGELAAAGVPIVAGTDSGNPWTVQGFSLHRELELLVEAGLSPPQALAAATTAAGDFLGRSWGLAPGDEGTVLVLDASPLEDIRNTRRIHLVVHHGRIVDREALLAD